MHRGSSRCVWRPSIFDPNFVGGYRATPPGLGIETQCGHFFPPRGSFCPAELNAASSGANVCFNCLGGTRALHRGVAMPHGSAALAGAGVAGFVVRLYRGGGALAFRGSRGRGRGGSDSTAGVVSVVGLTSRLKQWKASGAGYENQCHSGCEGVDGAGCGAG